MLIQAAAERMLAVNVANDTELDLATPIKKLHFEIDETEKQMQQLAESHTGQLMANFGAAELTKTAVATELVPSVERVKKSYARIEAELVGPYREALRRNEALRRLHDTVGLLRAASGFLVAAQVLEAAQAEEKPDILRVARATRDVSEWLRDASPQVLLLAIVSRYRPGFASHESRLMQQLAEQALADLAHHTLFLPENTELCQRLAALHAIGPDVLFPLLDKTVVKSVQVALAALTRLLQLPRGFAAALTDAYKSAEGFSEKFSLVLQHTELLQPFLQRLQAQDVLLLYWELLAHKFKKSVAQTMARGGPIAKSLKTNKPTMNSAVGDLPEDRQKPLHDALSIINA